MRRIATLGLSLLALAAFWLLVIGPPVPRTAPDSLPHSDDRGPFGLLAARTWLEKRGLATRSIREPISGPEDGLAPCCHLYVLSLPEASRVREGVYGETLVALAEAGNSVLVLDAAVDPRTAGERQTLNRHFVVDYLGVGFDEESVHHYRAGESEVDRKRRLREAMMSLQDNLAGQRYPTLYALKDFGGHPVVQGITEVQGVSAALPGHMTVKLRSDERPAIRLASDEHAGLWWIPVGPGQIYYGSLGGLISNQNLARADNARLLEQIARHTLNATGTVAFLDYYQGLREGFDPDRFYADPRVRSTMLTVLIVWLVYVLGFDRRLLTQAPRRPRIALALHQGLARLLSRKVAADEVLEALIEDFRQRLSRRLGAPPRLSLAVLIERLPEFDRARATAWCLELQSCRSPQAAHRLIEALETQINRK